MRNWDELLANAISDTANVNAAYDRSQELAAAAAAATIPATGGAAAAAAATTCLGGASSAGVCTATSSAVCSGLSCYLPEALSNPFAAAGFGGAAIFGALMLSGALTQESTPSHQSSNNSSSAAAAAAAQAQRSSSNNSLAAVAQPDDGFDIGGGFESDMDERDDSPQQSSNNSSPARRGPVSPKRHAELLREGADIMIGTSKRLRPGGKNPRKTTLDKAKEELRKPRGGIRKPVTRTEAARRRKNQRKVAERVLEQARADGMTR